MWLAVVVSLISCNRATKPIEMSGEAQGTYYSIIYYDSCHRQLQPQIDSLLDDFDETASLWVENSLLRRINRGEDSVLNDIMESLLDKSIAMNQYTSGAFDCRVGMLVNAWGFGFKEREDLSDQLVDSLLECSRGELEVMTNEQGQKVLRKSNAGTELDFNAIAQGYSVDLIGAYLEGLGIKNYLIDVGGEVLAKGHKVKGENWLVGIEKPAKDKYADREVDVVVGLSNQSVVTSGNYRKYYEKDGARYSHTIDPKTGRPVKHTLLSVSVIDSAAWRADALATAFMVMGLEESKQFLNQHPEIKGAYFIYDENGENKTYATPEFEVLIVRK